MESIHFSENGDCSDSTDAKISLPPDNDNCPEPEATPQIPLDSNDSIDIIFSEPEILPRVGDEYQAELPALVKFRSRKRRKYNTQIHPDHILFGNPIMLTWINTLKKRASGPNSKSMKAKGLDELHGLPTEENNRRRGGAGYILVPGLANFSWTALEKDSFLLGLYIFKKDFVSVKRLVATKNMGSLLKFYYGHFYHSSEYRRWSQWQKKKGKKGIAQRLVSGARQQELLNRILVGVSEDSQKDILEASKMFGEDRMSLSDYVFSLMVKVGIEALVNAVGIGKGKLDLTEMPLESSRSNPTRSDIPSGKALSSLTTEELVKILSGNSRLSKARANDIFWEAVWPRLLHRGWHSEQPKNFAKECLVFLTPGVKKFSRRKLVKGEHYFDSPTDILSKVAKEPELVSLDSLEEGGFGNKKEQCEISPDEKEPENEKHCYLKPRTPNRNVDVEKFTVVDTSLSGGKARELRSFPSDIAKDNGFERSGSSNFTDIAMAIDLDEKTKTDNKKKDSNRTKKVLKPRKAVKRESAEHKAPLPKRRRKLATCDQEEKKVPSPGVNEVGNSHDKTPLLIDLNLPGVFPEPENEEQNQAPNREPLNLNPRRLSTRYRPPTMRTMQAFADGYLGLSQKRKRKPKRTCGMDPEVGEGESGSVANGDEVRESDCFGEFWWLIGSRFAGYQIRFDCWVVSCVAWMFTSSAVFI